MTVNLILHPGHDKCGSTSIQNFLYSNTNALRDQNIYVADSNFRFVFDTPSFFLSYAAPIFYFEHIFNNKKFEKFEKRVETVISKAERAGCKSIIISAENLGHNEGREKGGKAHEILASYFPETSVIFYVRRQEDYLLSSWQQWGHRNGESLNEHIHQSLAIHRPNFLDGAIFFESIYGAGSVSVIPLSKHAFASGNLLSDFCQRAKIDITHCSLQRESENKGINPHICDIISRTPNIYTDIHDDSVKRVLGNYINNPNLLFQADKNIMPFNLRQEIISFFKDENEILRQKYFNELRYEDIFGCIESDIEKNGLSKQRNSYDELDKVKDVIAIQMDIIISILKQQESKHFSLRRTIKQAFRQAIKKLYS